MKTENIERLLVELENASHTETGTDASVSGSVFYLDKVCSAALAPTSLRGESLARVNTPPPRAHARAHAECPAPFPGSRCTATRQGRGRESELGRWSTR